MLSRVQRAETLFPEVLSRVQLREELGGKMLGLEQLRVALGYVVLSRWLLRDILGFEMRGCEEPCKEGSYEMLICRQSHEAPAT